MPVESVHIQEFDAPTKQRLEEIEDSDLQERFAALIKIRDVVNAGFEAFKAGGEVKDSQDAIAKITTDEESLALLRSFDPGELAVLFKMSWMELKGGPPSLTFERSPYLKCQRSRLRRPDVELVHLNGEEVPLTARDRRVLAL
jgi:isoleucyl-tRNA synthetase